LLELNLELELFADLLELDLELELFADLLELDVELELSSGSSLARFFSPISQSPPGTTDSSLGSKLCDTLTPSTALALQAL